MEMLRKNDIHGLISLASFQAEMFVSLYSELNNTYLTDVMVDARTDFHLSVVGFANQRSFVIGGLSFGYSGSGSKTLRDILIANGLPEDQAGIILKQRDNQTDLTYLLWDRTTQKIIIKDVEKN